MIKYSPTPMAKLVIAIERALELLNDGQNEAAYNILLNAIKVWEMEAKRANQ